MEKRLELLIKIAHWTSLPPPLCEACDHVLVPLGRCGAELKIIVKANFFPAGASGAARSKCQAAVRRSEPPHPLP